MAIRRGQSWLIEIFKKLGYRGPLTQVDWLEGDALCFGIAHMAMQAMLIKKGKGFKTFEDRMTKLTEATPEILNLVTSYLEKIESLRQTQEYTFEQLEPLYKEIKEKTGLDLQDLYYFAEGVETYQALCKYKSVHPSWSQWTQLPFAMSLVSPSKLDGDPITKVTSFSGVYGGGILTYLEKLKKIALSVDYRVPFVLNSSNHAICICYDKDEDKWIIVDANQLPKITANDQQMNLQITNAFFNFTEGLFYDTATYNIFSTDIYATESHAQELKELFEKKVSSNEEWNRLHNFEAEWAAKEDSNGATWLYLAAKYGYVTEVEELLLNTEVNPNKQTKIGYTPLHTAVYDSQTHVIKLLLKDNRVDPNLKAGNVFTPLHLAVKNGDTEIVKLLLEDARVDLEVANVNPCDLFSPAIELGNIETIELLLKDPRVLSRLNSIKENLTFEERALFDPLFNQFEKIQEKGEVSLEDFSGIMRKMKLIFLANACDLKLTTEQLERLFSIDVKTFIEDFRESHANKKVLCFFPYPSKFNELINKNNIIKGVDDILGYIKARIGKSSSSRDFLLQTLSLKKGGQNFSEESSIDDIFSERSFDNLEFQQVSHEYKPLIRL